jgi:regulator of nucleoside diphosphate kinase
MKNTLTITHEDRRRLGTVLQIAHSRGVHRREYVDALEAELELAQWSGSEEIPGNVVTMESTVQLRDLATGKSETDRLVYPDQADLGDGRISVLNPVGTAILGRREGDVVDVVGPSGRRRMRVEQVVRPPTRAKDRGCLAHSVYSGT